MIPLRSEADFSVIVLRLEENKISVPISWDAHLFTGRQNKPAIQNRVPLRTTVDMHTKKGIYGENGTKLNSGHVFFKQRIINSNILENASIVCPLS